MRGDLKISPWRIIKAHHETYVDARTNQRSIKDYLVLDATPLVVGGVCVWRSVQLSAPTSQALLEAAVLLSALLFGVMLQVSQRAADWSDDPPAPSRQTSDHARFLRELAANAGYASLVCIAAAVAFVVATASKNGLLEAASAVGLALAAHLLLTLLMVIKRVFALTDERLTSVRTGAADSKVVPHERRRHSA